MRHANRLRAVVKQPYRGPLHGAEPFHPGVLAWSLLAALLLSGCGTDQLEGPPGAQVSVMDTVARISLRGEALRSVSAPVAVNAAATRIAVGIRDAGEVLVFELDGALVERLGRNGQGPGEFREISAITFSPRSDTLWVVDNENLRLTVLPPGGAESPRTVPMDGPSFGIAWASDTTLLVQGQFASDDPSRSLLRAVHPGGVSVVAIGGSSPRPGHFVDFIRPVTSAGSGGVWLAHFRRPELRHFDSDLRETRDLNYAAELLGSTPVNADQWAGLIDTEPAVLGITEDENGSLWVLLGGPADPLPAVDDPGRALAEGEVGIEDLSITVLARYDEAAPLAGPLEEFPQGPLRGGLLPGGLAYSLDTDEEGEFTLTVVRFVTTNDNDERRESP